MVDPQSVNWYCNRHVFYSNNGCDFNWKCLWYILNGLRRTSSCKWISRVGRNWSIEKRKVGKRVVSMAKEQEIEILPSLPPVYKFMPSLNSGHKDHPIKTFLPSTGILKRAIKRTLLTKINHLLSKVSGFFKGLIRLINHPVNSAYNILTLKSFHNESFSWAFARMFTTGSE